MNIPSSSQVDTWRVQRMNNDPHVFFITDDCNLSPEHEDTLSCTTPFVTMLKNTKIMNIISLSFLITFPITVILGMANIECDSILGECHYYLFLFTFLGPFRVLCCLFSLLLVWYRLAFLL